MTVIVWDGATLAADKQATVDDRRATITKIHRLPDGLLGISGATCHASELLRWFRSPRNLADYPKRDIDSAFTATSVFINRTGRLHLYCADSPELTVLEDSFYAIGSGSRYAMGALAMGASAREAVEIASRFDVYCGMGVDVLHLAEGA